MAAWFRSMLIEDESSGKKNGYDARAANQVVEATSGFGPKRQLVRRSEMSEVEVKADSKANAKFGCD